MEEIHRCLDTRRYCLPCHVMALFFNLCIMCCKCSQYFVNNLQKLEVESYEYDFYFIHMAGENGESSRLVVKKIHWKGFREWIFQSYACWSSGSWHLCTQASAYSYDGGAEGFQWFFSWKEKTNIFLKELFISSWLCTFVVLVGKWRINHNWLLSSSPLPKVQEHNPEEADYWQQLGQALIFT